MNVSRMARWCSALATAGLAAGLLSGPAAGLAGTGSAGRVVPACTSADVKVGFRATDAGAGHRFGRITMTNISDHACRSGGYGGVSYVGNGDGSQIGAPADRDPGRIRSLVIQPGQRLVSPISETVAQNYPRHKCRPAHVDGFRVYIPNETKSQFVKHPTTGCRNAAVHLLSHKPYRRP